MLRDLYARYYRMSVEHPLRFIRLALLVLSLAAIGVWAIADAFAR